MADFPLPDDTPASAGSVPEVPSGVEPSGKPVWADWPDERLLELRMCDLGVAIEHSRLEDRIAELHQELEGKGITFRPHFWLSDEWFTPDGVPGVAIPFYLAHPRLIPARAGPDAGGRGRDAGVVHAHPAPRGGPRHRQRVPAATARRTRQRLFGRPSHAISRALHAQAVQQELRPAPRLLVRPEPPGRGLRRDLRRLADARRRCGASGTPAGRRCGSSSTWTQLMHELAGKPPACVSRAARGARSSGSARRSASTTSTSGSITALEHPNFYDRDLRRLFSDAPEDRRRTMTAARFIGAHPPRRPARWSRDWTGEYQYTDRPGARGHDRPLPTS